jgi:hypothetical protein
VLAVACDHQVTLSQGAIRTRVDQLAATLPSTAWQRYSAGVGSKGPRWYAWAWIDLADTGRPGQTLLIRRNTATGELAFYRCWTPTSVGLPALVRVAGIRWCVEESFQAAKGQVGLDHYQVHGWKPWHRFITLAMLALAILTILTAITAPPDGTDPHRYARQPGPVALTTSEIRRLLNALIIGPVHSLAHLLHWSNWRRRHQTAARRAHYLRRLTT